MIIVIKDMKMPTNCRTCPLLYVPSICDGSKHCPLIPVPQHGNLIDADRLGLTDFEILSCQGNYKTALSMLLEKIENAPIIIPADY